MKLCRFGSTGLVNFFGWLIIFTLSNCHTSTSHIIVLDKKTIDVDTIHFFSLHPTSHDPDLRLYQLIGLDPIQQSQADCEIRIKRIYSEFKPLYLIVIKKFRQIWTGYALFISPEINLKNETGRYVPKIIGHDPKIGWDSLYRILVNIGISKIGKEIPLEHYGVPTDSDEADVEFSIGGISRKYRVFDPEFDPSPGKKEMIRILKTVERELDISGLTSASPEK